MFRMAHVFLALGQVDQAHHVAASIAAALEPKITGKTEPAVLSLYGASHLILAVAAARDNQRGRAHQHLDAARKIAGQLGADRDDYGTRNGPSNVAIHAVNIAVELGDAGQAIELAQHMAPGSLFTRTASPVPDGPSPQAHAMRRQIGEALHALTEAERIAPEETRVHYVGRAVTRDLLQLSGLRPRPELRDLAERFGALPARVTTRLRRRLVAGVSPVRTLGSGGGRFCSRFCTMSNTTSDANSQASGCLRIRLATVRAMVVARAFAAAVVLPFFAAGVRWAFPGRAICRGCDLSPTRHVPQHTARTTV